jgi:peroxiredoxin family protein
VAETLGIFVATRNNLPHIIGLTQAAKAAGKEVKIFFTGDGVLLSQEPRFGELIPAARVGICEVSYNAHGFKGKEVQGLGYKDFVTQAFNAEMVEECDRYVVL